MKSQEQAIELIKEYAPYLMELKDGCRIKIKIEEECGYDDLMVSYTRGNTVYFYEQVPTDYGSMQDLCMSLNEINKDYDVIGKDIHLEDVLSAIKERYEEDNSMYYIIYELCYTYDFKKSFHEQSNELYRLLVNILN